MLWKTQVPLIVPQTFDVWILRIKYSSSFIPEYQEPVYLSYGWRALDLHKINLTPLKCTAILCLLFECYGIIFSWSSGLFAFCFMKWNLAVVSLEEFWRKNALWRDLICGKINNRLILRTTFWEFLNFHINHFNIWKVLGTHTFLTMIIDRFAFDSIPVQAY